jgi:hypothetical protein
MHVLEKVGSSRREKHDNNSHAPVSIDSVSVVSVICGLPQPGKKKIKE